MKQKLVLAWVMMSNRISQISYHGRSEASLYLFIKKHHPLRMSISPVEADANLDRIMGLMKGLLLYDY